MVYLLLNALLISLSVVGARNSFELHQHAPIVANTVGPFNNPTETYPYYKLPFCTAGGKQRRHKQNLGEVLSGSRKVTTPYDLTFMDPVPWRSLCEEYLDAADVRWTNIQVIYLPARFPHCILIILITLFPVSITIISFLYYLRFNTYRLKSSRELSRTISSLKCTSMICQCGGI